MDDEERKRALEQNEMWLWRGYAIGAYSMLEQALCELFKKLLGTTNNRAAIVFFQMHNARSRNTVIEKLIKDKFGSSYNLFWNSLFNKHLNKIDDRRNSIVHWAMIYRFSIVQPPEPVPDRLIPPNMWAYKEGSPEIKLADLKEFVKHVDIVAAYIANFNMWVCQQVTLENADHRTAWLDIFRQALPDPLPSEIHSDLSPGTLRNLPRSSQK